MGTGSPRPILWCLKRPDLYGPGLLAHGLDPGRIVLVTAAHDDELLWAMEEGLRAPGLAAVVGEIGRLPMVASRRLQLAAERSGVTAFVLRRWRNAAEAAAERERPSAAVTRWRVTALPSRALYPHPNPPPPAGEGVLFRPSVASPPTLPSPSLFRPSPAGGGGQGGGEAPIAGRPWVGQTRWRVELLRCRGGRTGSWDVEVADATGHVSLSAELADRPAASRPSRQVAPLGRPEPQRRTG